MKKGGALAFKVAPYLLALSLLAGGAYEVNERAFSQPTRTHLKNAFSNDSEGNENLSGAFPPPFF